MVNIEFCSAGAASACFRLPFLFIQHIFCGKLWPSCIFFSQFCLTSGIKTATKHPKHNVQNYKINRALKKNFFLFFLFFLCSKTGSQSIFFKTTTTSPLLIHTDTSYPCYVDLKDINSSVAKNMIHAANVRRRSLHVKVWSDEFASNRGDDDNPRAQRASLCRTNIASLRDCRQQFSFQLWWSIARGSESDAVALIQPRSLPSPGTAVC